MTYSQRWAVVLHLNVQWHNVYSQCNLIAWANPTKIVCGAPVLNHEMVMCLYSVILVKWDYFCLKKKKKKDCILSFVIEHRMKTLQNENNPQHAGLEQIRRQRHKALIPTRLRAPLLDWLEKSVHKLFPPSLHPLAAYSSTRVKTVGSDITATHKKNKNPPCLQVFFWYRVDF